MILIDFLFGPFIAHSFMLKALVASFAVSLGSTLIGNFLLLRRMSFIGDALSHSILPGIAIGYLLGGKSFVMMSIGGFISGFLLAIFSIYLTSNFSFREDASFTGFYLGFSSLGVIIISFNGLNNDIIDILFGSVLSIDISSIQYIGIVSSVTVIIVSIIYRALVIEIFDSSFLNINIIKCSYIKILFFILVILNLIASIYVVGSLMSLGLMILPVLVARCWFDNLPGMILFSIFISFFCSWGGLIGSFYMISPPGPIIILFVSILFLLSIFLKKYIKYFTY